ncbi:hypothetical protein Leryth_003617 [Lithospermum erythrorhizon]|nr:hypothetical protein Leryth_003617 [Lithospermum erythrorhizon]
MLSRIPVIKWNRTPRFMLDPNWHIVAGEESREVAFEKQREMRVLEAIYPRPSAIPANPVLVGAKESFHSDQLTLVIPITPIEDEDAADPSSHALLTNDGAMNLPVLPLTSQGTFATVAPPHQMAASGIEPHLAVAVAQATLAAVTSNNDQGKLIDPNLLLEILNNPQLIEQLVRMQGSSSEMQNLPAASTTAPQVASMQDVQKTPGRNIAEQAPLPNKIEPAQGYVSRLEPSATSITAASSSSLYPPSRIAASPSLRQPVPNTSAPSSSVSPAQKDVNYYRSLIQQHGGERQDTLPNFSTGSNLPVYSKLRDSETKNVKPCMFYNTPRGCRNGENCAFEHVSTSQQRLNPVPDVQNNKRMKMDGGIYGT